MTQTDTWAGTQGPPKPKLGQAAQALPLYNPATADPASRTARLVATHAWLPPQTVTALVDSGMSDQELNGTLEQMRHAAIATDQSTQIKHATKPLVSVAHQDKKLRDKLAARDKLTQDAGQAPTDQYAQMYNSPDVLSNAQLAVKQTPVEKGVKQAKKTVQNSFSFTQFFDDPVLQKHPSAGMALKQYLSGAVGQWPVEEKHLADVQRALQVSGYGRGLPVDGVYSPEWQQAFYGYSDALYKTHLSGSDTGSVSLKTALKGLEALQPTNAFDAVLGFIQSIPGDVRDTLADVAGSTAGLAYTVGHPSEWSRGDPSQGHKDWHGDTSAAVINFLGGDTTSKKEIDSFQHHYWSHLVRDMSTVYLLTGTFGAGKRLAEAIGEGSAALPEAIAARGPGVIAHTLERGAHFLDTTAGRTLTGAALGGGGAAAAGGSSSQIVGGALGGGLLSNVLSQTGVYDHIPIMGKIGPTVDSLLDADGLYYKTRRFLHGPYKYAPVRIAGQTFQDLNMLGAQVRGAAALQSMDAPTGMSEAVQGEHTFSTADAAIAKRFHATILGQSISPSINDLQFVLHAGPEFSSGVVTHMFENMAANREALLGNTGFEAAVQRITGNKWAKEVAKFDTPEQAYTFWEENLAKHAAGYGADHARQTELAGGGVFDPESISDNARVHDLQARSHAILTDPDALNEAIIGLRSQGIGAGLEDYIARVKLEEAVSKARPSGSMIQSAPQYMRAKQVVKDELFPYLDHTIEGAGPKITAADKVLLGLPDSTQDLGLAKMSRLVIGGADPTTNVDRIIAGFKEEAAAFKEREMAHATPTDLESFDLPARPSLDEHNDLTARMMHSLYEGFGVDSERIPYKSHDELIQAMEANRALLSSAVVANPDAPQYIKDTIDKLHEMGYKLIAGQDTGSLLTPTGIDILDGPLTWRRRALENLAINPTAQSNRSVSMTAAANQISELDKAVKAGKIELPPAFDAVTLWHWMHSKDFLEQSPGWAKKTLLEAFRTPERVAAANHIDIEEARKELNAAINPSQIPRKKIVAALTDPAGYEAYAPASSDLNGMLHGLDDSERYLNKFKDTHAQAMTTSSANEVVAALRRGARLSPTYQLGLSRIDDMFRASMGFVGKGTQYRAGMGALVGAGTGYVLEPDDPRYWIGGGAGGAALMALGGDKLGWAMANLPNRLVQLRDEMRFELSPMFSWRRLAKANAKLGLEGVPFTMNPLKAMERAGTLEADRAVFQRVHPEFYNEYADAGDRALKSQDVFGFFNERNMETRAAGHWARAGFSDDEIRAKLVKTFEYGSGTTAGRSALERSANYLFFPFSFDKTLYRNFGYYLLDNPAQRVVLTRGMAAYDQFNREHMDGSNPLATSFYTKHLPLLTEVANLNAFAHGISAGEVGGINRPLLNLFLPQNWSANADSLKKLQRFLPVLKDFQRIYNESIDQGKILKNAGVNVWRDSQIAPRMYRDLNGIPSKYGNPAKSTLDSYDQMGEAFAMQRNWYASYAKYIDHNSSTRDPAEQYKFPNSAEWGTYAGKPITKANIRDIIHGYYPAYDPNGAVKIVTERSAEFNDYVDSTKPAPGTPADSPKWDRYNYITTFAKKAKELGRAMSDTSSDAPTGKEVAQYTDILRQGAIWLSEHDPDFYALYAKNFQRILGPLEKVQ